MTRRSWSWLFAVVLLAVAASACGDDTKGACIPRASPQSCGDDYTSGECDLMNGDFYPNKTCEELGR